LLSGAKSKNENENTYFAIILLTGKVDYTKRKRLLNFDPLQCRATEKSLPNDRQQSRGEKRFVKSN
jgi:hypothetical protein